ncbi:MAG: FliH/SctL family protein [Bacillota bacterium]
MYRVVKASQIEYSPAHTVTLEPKLEQEDAKAEEAPAPVEIGQQADPRLEELIRQAQLIAAEERKAAAAQGFAEGFKEGLAQGAHEALCRLSEVLRQAEQLLAEAKRARETAVKDLEPEIISLACSVAERIVKKTVELDPETVVRVAKHVLESAQLQPPVTIKVSAEDLEVLRERVDELKAVVGGHVDLSPDGSVSRGGCIAESQVGSVDGDLLTQLENIKKQLLEEIGTGQEGVKRSQ